jgi:hypothetical protein
MIMLGFVPVALSAFLALRSYLDYLKERELLCFAFLELLDAIERGLTHSLKTPAECISELSSPCLLRVGFAELVLKGETLCGAFEKCRERIMMPKEACELLYRLFSTLGTGYLEGELTRVRDARRELEGIADVERGKRAERGRVAGAVLFAATSGLMLLIV